MKDVQVSLVIASIHHKEALLQELQTEYRGLTGTFFPFFLSAWNLQVVGVKDDRLGEQVCACIRVAEGQHCTVEEIKAYCKDQVTGMTTFLHKQRRRRKKKTPTKCIYVISDLLLQNPTLCDVHWELSTYCFRESKVHYVLEKLSSCAKVRQVCTKDLADTRLFSTSDPEK